MLSPTCSDPLVFAPRLSPPHPLDDVPILFHSGYCYRGDFHQRYQARERTAMALSQNEVSMASAVSTNDPLPIPPAKDHELPRQTL